MPPIHHREHGDLYMLLADIYLKINDTDKAVFYLDKMVNYDLYESQKIDNNTNTKSPLLNSIPHGLYQKRIDRYQNLVTKLTDSRFEILQNNEQYQRLVALTTK